MAAIRRVRNPNQIPLNERASRVQNKRLQRLFARIRTLLGRWERLKPLLERAHLWRWSRRSVAIGAAIGVFFGFLIPIGQIPASAILAAWLRANLPIAVASTCITNPITIAPAYYGMYLLGSWLIGSNHDELVSKGDLLGRVGEVGEALLIGIPVSAVLMAGLTYLLVHLTWFIWLRLRRPRLWRWARAFVIARRRACARAR